MCCIVCWDLDETLGYFRPLEFSFLGEPIPSLFPAPKLKPRIKELLVSTQEFMHVVTTAAVEDYARYVLRGNGLLECFVDVIGRERGIFRYAGKDYKVVGDQFGIEEADLHKRLIIVGDDHKQDSDVSYRQVVMIYDKNMWETPSEPLAVVLRRLLEAGEGNPKMGFDSFLARSRAETAFDREVILEPERVRFNIAYWGSLAEKKTHPMIIRPTFVS